jgi:hypothetical protein
MTILEITIKELPSFIHSELYKGSRMVPVTPERAISQANNPRAQPDDVALIVAYTKEGQLAGFAGLLPDTGNSKEGPYRFAWNSGWWVDKELGKGIALNLFYRSIQAWEGQILITHLTPHTRKIIELTRLFYFADPVRGIRYQILSDFSGKFRRKFRSLRIFSGLFAFTDTLINAVLQYRLRRWKRKKETGELKTETVQDFDKDILNFIERHSRGELCRRGKPEFEWIRAYPWMVMEAPGAKTGKYPFSRECKLFEYRWTKILFHGEIAGIALLTNREGLFKISYAYYEAGLLEPFSRALCLILIDRKATGFYTVRGEIGETMEKTDFPVFYKKPVIQELAVSRTISKRQPENFFLQDGDGDGVFT